MRTRLVLSALCAVAAIPLVAPGVASSFWSSGKAFRAQAAPTWDFAENAPFYSVERSGCLAVAIGPSAASECGSLRVVHQLPSVRTFNSLKTPTLLYNSEFAHPHAVLPLRITLAATTDRPDSVEVQVNEYNYTTWAEIPKQTFRWAGSEWPAGQNATRSVSMAMDRINDTTCYCIFTAQVTNIYPGGIRMTSPYTNTWGIFIVNRKNSSFGKGWWLGGFERLMINGPANQKVWFNGDGSARFFLPLNDSTFFSASYDKVDSLYKRGSPITYIKTNSEGVRTHFDQFGNHTKTVDRFGRTTVFHYTGSVLDSIKLPITSQVYRFAYVGGRLATVTAPPIGATTRVTNVTTSAGLITQIRNPGDSAVIFAYYPGNADSGLMSKRVNRRGVVDTFSYDQGKRISSSRIKMAPDSSIVWSLVQGQTRGLPNSGSPSSVDTGKVYTRIDGPRTNVADTTVIRQIQFGAPSKITNALNEPPTLLRYGCGGEIAQYPCNWVPMRVQHPTGRVTLTEYNWKRGRLLRLIDSVTQVSGQRDTIRFEWDSTFDQLKKVVNPERDSMIYSINTSNGRREWSQDARGLASRVTFGYDPTHTEQVTSVTLPAISGQPAAVYSHTYDATLRNLATETTPKGFVTTYTRDGIGRAIKIERMIEATLASNKRTVQKTLYDLRDYVIYDTSTTINVTPTETVVVRNFLNPEGQADSVQRWTSPDPANIGTLTTRFKYDLAGRLVATVPVGNNPPATLRDSTVYDEAGNATAVYTRLFPVPAGPAIMMQYDAVN